MRNGTISYSQCWEDPEVLLKALKIDANDTVLSITSGGDNSLALLAECPKSVVAIDLNPPQNYLLELKRSAARRLEYEEYLEFLGATKTKGRVELFSKVRNDLPSAADEWWSAHPNLLAGGVIHAGRFERFTAFFARYVLPCIHSKETIRTLLLSKDMAEQESFYRKRWNTPLWKLFFGLATSKLLLGHARQKAMFAYAHVQNVATVYRQRLEQHLTTRPVRGNFFLQYSLTGNYTDALPPYLERSGYEAIKKSRGEVLQVISSDLHSYLRTKPENSFSKFNLSDIFEALSAEEHEELWIEIVRTARPNARVAYWTNLVPRSLPMSVSSMINDEIALAVELRAVDRVFFYDAFHIHSILK